MIIVIIEPLDEKESALNQAYLMRTQRLGDACAKSVLHENECVSSLSHFFHKKSGSSLARVNQMQCGNTPSHPTQFTAKFNWPSSRFGQITTYSTTNILTLNSIGLHYNENTTQHCFVCFISHIGRHLFITLAVKLKTLRIY